VNDSLKSKTLYGISWSFVDAVILRGVQFIVGILLTRLLFPAQFGLIGMLAVFFAVAQAFLLSGFGSALIQKRDATQIDMCSIFYFNIVVGILAAGLLCIVAPWIAAFYHQPILSSMTMVLSITLVINSFGVVQTTSIIKNVNFKLLSKVTAISSVISGLISVMLALNGFGVWSLVALQVSDSFFRTVTLWVINTWRPEWIFSFDSLKEMFGFGSRLLLTNILNQFFNNIHFIVIGKLFSASDLGYFTRAKSLQELPSNTFSDMVGRVTFPVFSSIQDDPVRIRQGFKKVLTGMALVIFPLMIGLAVVSRPLVIILLTDKWVQSIPYIQLMCIVGMFYPLQLININVLTAIGKSGIILRLEIIRKTLLVISIVFAWRYGIIAMIYGIIFVEIISYSINCHYLKKLVRYSLYQQIYDVLPYLIMASIMGFVVYLVGLLNVYNPVLNNIASLLSQIVLGCLVYVALCWLFKLDVFMDILKFKWKSLSVSEVNI